MTDIEFLMNKAGINISKMNEEEKQFIKYEVIPYFEALPLLKSSTWYEIESVKEELQKPWIVVNNETGEERTLNPEEILKELKELVKDCKTYEIPKMNDVEFVLTSYDMFNKKNRLTKRAKSKLKNKIIPSLEADFYFGSKKTTTISHDYIDEDRELKLEVLDELRKIANDDNDYILSNPDFNQRGKITAFTKSLAKIRLVPYYDLISFLYSDLHDSEEN